jgi:regulator of RNase E activity RraA
MAKLSEQQMLKKLEKFNTPTVGNIVATFAARDPLCLGIYHPWYGRWYTDQSVRCIYPELGPRIGYAVTVVYSLSDPDYKRWSFTDLIDVFGKTKKPIVLVCQQDFPPDLLPRNGLFGGIMTATFKACSVIGVVTNGPSRDVDEIRKLNVQYIMSGVTSGHGEFAIRAINVPVSVAGMDVAPGDLIHMDENGACKFPADRLADVCRNIEEKTAFEDRWVDSILNAKNIEEIKATFPPKKAK